MHIGHNSKVPSKFFDADGYRKLQQERAEYEEKMRATRQSGDRLCGNTPRMAKHSTSVGGVRIK